MSSTGFMDPLLSTLVESPLEVIQSSALSQISQAHLLQGPRFGGFSYDGRVECIHVTATKFFPLLRREGLGSVFLVDVRRITTSVSAALAADTRWAMRPINHQDFGRRIAAIALGCGLRGASRQIEQAVESFVGLDCSDLVSGRLPSHHVFHPSLKPRSTGSLVATNSGE